MSAEPSLKLMKIEIKGNKVVRKEFKSLAIWGIKHVELAIKSCSFRILNRVPNIKWVLDLSEMKKHLRIID